MSDAGSAVFLARGFRPFFLFAGLYGVLAIGGWVAVLRGVLPAPAWSTPFQWHAHEMVFGFAGAAISGFLLTSVPVWTGRPPIVGTRLGAVVGLWLAGRLSILMDNALPSGVISAVLDASYFLVLAVCIGPAIYGARSRRNYAFPVLCVVLALANLVTHLGAHSLIADGGAAGMRLGIGVVIVLLVVVGGRLVPLFTRNALARGGSAREVSQRVWADRATGPLVAAFFVADVLAPGSAASGVLALCAGVVLALRTTGWQLRNTFGDPLLWSMHVAYLWLPIGLVLLGASAFTPFVPRAIAIHALTAGAIGGMALAIMTRVALGHTGRPFRAPRGIAFAYALVAAAAVARTFGIWWLPSAGGWLLLASGGMWVLAFGTFVAIYAPMLVAPRIDGQPG